MKPLENVNVSPYRILFDKKYIVFQCYSMEHALKRAKEEFGERNFVISKVN